MTQAQQPQPPKFQQGPRSYCAPPQATLAIPSPGTQEKKPVLALESVLIPLSIMIAGAVIAVRFFNSGGYVLIGILMAVGGAAVTAGGFLRQRLEYRRAVDARAQAFEAERRRIEENLNELRAQTQRCLLYNNPDIIHCLDLAAKRDAQRLWARIVRDPDFLHARLGIGAIPFQVTVELPPQMNQLVKDELEKQAEELRDRFKIVSDVPVLLDLCGGGNAGIVGRRADTILTARTVAAQLAVHHSPEVLRVAAVYPKSESAEWGWLRWLPHVWRPDRQLRYLADDYQTAQHMLEDLVSILRQRENQLATRPDAAAAPAWPTHYVVFIADPTTLNPETRRMLTENGPRLGFHSVFLSGREAELPRGCGVVVRAGPSATLQATAHNQPALAYAPDVMSLETAEELSRLLAPLRFESSVGAIPNLVSLFDVLAISRVEEWDALTYWKSDAALRSLTIPIGIGAGGQPVLFDLHDAGHGPHGLAAGTSGSGKTRFLECMVAILAAHFHPHELSFILIDFKGSDFLQTLPDLPHCISTLSSIEGKSEAEQTWYAMRALQALQAESRRRQRLFADLKAEEIDNISKYHKKRRSDPTLPPMPRLVIIVDEFAELASQQPDFLAGLVSVARIGRSLGMHLILSTQQPAGIVTEQIWANSRFKLSLKFARTEDSQAVLKRPDAAYIEQRGRGYLQVGENEVFELFQGPYGGIPYEETEPDQVQSDQDLEVIRITLNGQRVVHLKKDDDDNPKKTQLRALVEYLQEQASGADIVPVPDLLPRDTSKITTLAHTPSNRGWNGSGWDPAREWLRPIIGVLDDPSGQLTGSAQDLLWLQPNLGTLGHLFICCDMADNTKLPLRTVITRLVTDHSPAELTLYGLDFGNNALAPFAGLPHTGAIIRASETRRITRLFRWLATELEERRDMLAGLSYSEARRSGHMTRPAIILVIDNLIKWKDEGDRWDEIGTLINEGAQNGIHLILAGEGRAALRFASVLGNINPRLALGFPDRNAFREVIDNMAYDQNILGGTPDQGAYYDTDTGVLECRVVAPVEAASADEAEDNLRKLIGDMARAARRAGLPQPFPILELPDELPLAEVMPPDIVHSWQTWRDQPKLSAVIGIDDLTLEPLVVDLQNDGPHFLVLGPPGGGKTTALRSWILSLAGRVPPDDVRIILFDGMKRNLSPLLQLPHVEDAGSNEDVTTLFNELQEALGDRTKPGLPRPVVMVFDDLAWFDDPFLRGELVKLIRLGTARGGLHVLAAGRTADLSQYGDAERSILRYRSGLFIGSNPIEKESVFFDINLPLGQARDRLPHGRGYLVRQGEYRLVQVATPGSPDDLAAWIDRLCAAWSSSALPTVQAVSPGADGHESESRR